MPASPARSQGPPWGSHARLPDLGDLAVHLFDDERREACRGLVYHEELYVLSHQAPRDRDGLPFAPAQGEGQLALPVGDVREEPEHPLHVLSPCAPSYLRERAGHEVLLDGHLRK